MRVLFSPNCCVCILQSTHTWRMAQWLNWQHSQNLQFKIQMVHKQELIPIFGYTLSTTSAATQNWRKARPDDSEHINIILRCERITHHKFIETKDEAKSYDNEAILCDSDVPCNNLYLCSIPGITSNNSLLIFATASANNGNDAPNCNCCKTKIQNSL